MSYRAFDRAELPADAEVVEHESCWRCGGRGYFDLYEEDPINNDPGDAEVCSECLGEGHFYVCWVEEEMAV